VAILGNNTTYGGILTPGAGRIWASKHTLAAAGAVNELWCRVQASTSGNTYYVSIYTDSGGVPASLLVASAAIAYTGSEDPKALGVTGLSTPIAAGTYWVGVTTANSNGYVKQSGLGDGVSTAIFFSAGPPPPPTFGTPGYTGTENVSAWAVIGAAAAAPVSDFSATPTVGAPPLAVVFTDLSSNTPTSWAWTFGDGGTSTVQNPSHTYTAAGTYTVALVATNTAGSNTKTRTGYVTVSAPVDLNPPGVSIAFGDPWDEPDPTWTRLDTLAGCRVRGWTVDRGRPNEFAKTGTGTATVRIADLDGLFDPTNATSPYYPNVLPGRQAAISLYNPVSSTWHIRFRGFVEAYRYVLSQTREHMELQLDLVDGFAMLARAELRPGRDGALPPFTGMTPDQIAGLNNLVAEGNVLYGETAGPALDRLQAILGDVEWPPEWAKHNAIPGQVDDLFTLNVRLGPKAYGPGTSALDALWDAVDGDWPGVSNMYCGADGHLKARGRQARFRPTVAEYGITPYTVGDLATIAADTAAVPVSELEWAIEDSQVCNACIATPEKVGTGGSCRPYDPAVDDPTGAMLVTDEPSRAAYGLQSLTFDNLQTIEDIATGEGSLAAVKKFATYYVENSKDPHVRISRIVFKSRRPGADHGSPLWAFLNNVEISDLLTVKTAHGGGGGFFREFFVEGLHYTCRPGAPNVPVVELSLDVSPREHWTTNPFDTDEDP
jgi:PKD repeat protein